MREKIKVALAQISCKQGDKEENIRKIEENVRKARQKGADLVVFPELSCTGYAIKDQISELAETIPGPSTRVLEELARETETHIVFGIPELGIEKPKKFYNAAVLVGPQGFIGKYRKTYIPSSEFERDYHPGNQAAVFETELGKIGLIVCYDVFFPEVTRLARLKGAQLIVCISASPECDEGSPIESRPFLETFTAARAMENTAFMAYVNLAGVEDELRFWGGSRLIRPNGKVQVRAKYDEEDLVVGEINYADIEPVEKWVPVIKELRNEIFDELKATARARENANRSSVGQSGGERDPARPEE
jgi:predicted amidohydrolase